MYSHTHYRMTNLSDNSICPSSTYSSPPKRGQTPTSEHDNVVTKPQLWPLNRPKTNFATTQNMRRQAKVNNSPTNHRGIWPLGKHQSTHTYVVYATSSLGTQRLPPIQRSSAIMKSVVLAHKLQANNSQRVHSTNSRRSLFRVPNRRCLSLTNALFSTLKAIHFT